MVYRQLLFRFTSRTLYPSIVISHLEKDIIDVLFDFNSILYDTFYYEELTYVPNNITYVPDNITYVPDNIVIEYLLKQVFYWQKIGFCKLVIT